MGLFEKKSEAEKEAEKAQAAAAKEAKKNAREDKREARQDAREDKRDARQEARDDKKAARQDARAEKKEARQDKRDAMKDIRQSDLKGEARRDAKSDVRQAKHDAIDDAQKEKREAIDAAREEKKDAIAAERSEKRSEIDRVNEERAVALAAASDTSGFDAKFAIELLALTYAAQWDDPLVRSATLEVQSGMTGTLTPCELNGSPVRNAIGITGTSFKSDTECFVARTDGRDVIVAFRGSEVALFDRSGALKDWVLTDFRANRIPYPPAPKAWPDQRWVHAGFWQAYNLIRHVLIAEVTRQANLGSGARRIYVTGFSLGGALALLAALDLADALRDIPVELFTFAAPRAGDASLNALLKDRVAKSTIVAVAGDPIVHLPPLGPNFPVTFKHPLHVDLAEIHIPLANPLPQVNQQYRTADNLVYIDGQGAVKDRFPLAQVALMVTDHDWQPYHAALKAVLDAQSQAVA